MRHQRIGVIGGGAWGTALAQTLSAAGHDVALWAREREVVDDINQRHVNQAFLPGVRLPPTLTATTELAEVADRNLLLMVAPAQHVRDVGRALAGLITPGTPVILCAKGIEQATGKLVVEVLAEALPEAVPAVLSGPSFAADVARGLPTAVTLATPDPTTGRALAETLAGRHFRIYWTNDLIGTELGGAIKNVLAIAAGIVDGRGLGASAHAAMVTRGFAEMRRLGEALGARSDTLMGLSGLGDLLLTCGSPQSRNMSLGRALGQGQSLANVLGSRRSVAEGVFTASAVVQLADRHKIEMPIVAAVDGIVNGRLTIDQAITALLSRPLRAEGT